MKIAIMSLALLLSLGAHAQQQQSTTDKSTTVKKADLAPITASPQDIDDEITNAKLRAATGAKSQLSFFSTFTYSGGALSNPTSTERPQLNQQAAADPTTLTGQVAMKYRLTEHDNLSAGIGVQYTPSYVSNRATDEKTPAAANVSTPYLDYTRVFRSGVFQHVLEATLSKYTFSSDVNQSKLDYEVAVAHTFMADLGQSKFELGMASSFTREIYSDSNPSGIVYALEFDPILEYALTDKASFRTVYRAVSLAARNRDTAKWSVADQTESLGFGYAITRDIYIYPNMQWKWTAISADQSTVGLSANINL